MADKKDKNKEEACGDKKISRFLTRKGFGMTVFLFRKADGGQAQDGFCRCDATCSLEPIRITLSIAVGCKARRRRCRDKIVLDVVFRYACGDFAPAALVSGFSLDLITKELPG